MGTNPPSAAIVAPDQSSHALATQRRCARDHCPNPAKRGKRWAKYCSPKCRWEVWAYKHGRKSHLCGPKKKRVPALEFDAWRDTANGQTVTLEATKRALRLKAAGFRHYSIDAIIHAIRFDRSVELGPEADGYRISDHHSSRLARVLMERVPELAGFFETRKLRA